MAGGNTRHAFEMLNPKTHPLGRTELKINNKSLRITNVNQMKKSTLLILATTALTSLVAITARAQNPVVVNKIYVTSFKSAKVRVFLTNGMPTKPNVKTQLNPTGVAVASNGHVYVANFGANTVTTYDATGKPISPTITGLGGPFALAFDPSGQLCVLNQTSATITKYQADGTLLGTINIPISPTV